jgi:hypothetical protein
VTPKVKVYIMKYQVTEFENCFKFFKGKKNLLMYLLTLLLRKYSDILIMKSNIKDLLT